MHLTHTLSLGLLCCIPAQCIGQALDTTQEQNLKPITITAYQIKIPTVATLSDIHQTYLIAGKRSEVIDIQNLNANIAEKTGRQLFARIPGAFVYDMDGSGNQVNIATRGLDPHRSWEFNIRQNGIMTNSDIYGYPASHYSMPMEAVQRIELVRGTASLQYGAEFGGMINYIIKTPDTTQEIGLENSTTAGSFGLFSSYTSMGGRSGKWQYLGYYAYRRSDGYRDNSASKYNAQFANLSYQATPYLRFTAELGRSDYLYQLPGQLTDSMFRENPRQSTRSRNYFNPAIWVPSLRANWDLPNRTTHIELVSSAVLGERASVRFDAFANVPDAIDPATGQYSHRTVDIDNFNSYTTELRLLQQYRLWRMQHTLASGIRYIHNNLHRRQLGKGTTGVDYDVRIDESGWGRDLHFKTQNIAFFVENQFKITRQFSVSPGFRIENGVSKVSGILRYLDATEVPNEIKHAFPLFGVNLQYQYSPDHKIYGGWSQAYRPAVFKDIVPGSVLERAGKNLKDAYGYNAELGISGNWRGRFRYNVSLFQVKIKNRLGSFLQTDASTGESYILKTNIGNSLTSGVEAFLQVFLVMNPTTNLAIFSSSSYMDAHYQEARISNGAENLDVSGNRVESVPRWISRNGLDLAYKKWSLNILFSYTAESFSDPANTVQPSANGANGIVPAYGIWDVGIGYRLRPNITIKANMNNLFDLDYFTKRPQFYPGPGIWPSDGRGFQVSIQTRL